MPPTSKILTIRSIPILTACLLGLAPVAFSQTAPAAAAQADKADKDLCATLGKPPKPKDSKTKKDTVSVCVDLKAPVTPLPLELLPNVKLTIHVVNKSPWQKVNIECKRSVIGDPIDTQLANLAKRLGSWGAVLIPEVTRMKPLDAATSRERMRLALEPFLPIRSGFQNPFVLRYGLWNGMPFLRRIATSG